MLTIKKVTNATPGVFFYYAYVTAPAVLGANNSFVIEVRETKDTDLNKYFLISGSDKGNTQQMRLTTANCGNVNFTASFIDYPGNDPKDGSAARYVVTGATAGAKYVVSIKYDVKSIVGGVYSGADLSSTFNFQSFVGTNVNTLIADTDSLGHIDASAGTCINPNTDPVACTVSNPMAKTTADAGSDIEDGTALDASFEVYPVPFKDQLSIRYKFDYKTDVKIAMYFIKVTTNRGSEIRKIVSGR
jgi:hypothetical protein